MKRPASLKLTPRRLELLLYSEKQFFSLNSVAVKCQGNLNSGFNAESYLRSEKLKSTVLKEIIKVTWMLSKKSLSVREGNSG